MSSLLDWRGWGDSKTSSTLRFGKPCLPVVANTPRIPCNPTGIAVSSSVLRASTTIPLGWVNCSGDTSSTLRCSEPCVPVVADTPRIPCDPTWIAVPSCVLLARTAVRGRGVRDSRGWRWDGRGGRRGRGGRGGRGGHGGRGGRGGHGSRGGRGGRTQIIGVAQKIHTLRISATLTTFVLRVLCHRRLAKSRTAEAAAVRIIGWWGYGWCGRGGRGGRAQVIGVAQKVHALRISATLAAFVLRVLCHRRLAKSRTAEAAAVRIIGWWGHGWGCRGGRCGGRPSITYGNQARHLRPKSMRDCLALLVGPDEGLICAIFNGLVDGSLWTRKNQIVFWHAALAKTPPHRQPGVICSIAIEIPTLPILVRLRKHRNFRVDVTPFPCLIPPIDLHLHLTRQGDVENMKKLPLPAWLKKLSDVVVDNFDEAVRRIEARGEFSQDLLSIISRMLFSNHKRVALQRRTAHCNLLGHGETIGGMGRQVLALDNQSVALYDPKLSRSVIVRMHAIERHRVRVTIDRAILCRSLIVQNWRGRCCGGIAAEHWHQEQEHENDQWRNHEAIAQVAPWHRHQLSVTRTLAHIRVLRLGTICALPRADKRHNPHLIVVSAGRASAAHLNAIATGTLATTDSTSRPARSRAASADSTSTGSIADHGATATQNTVVVHTPALNHHWLHRRIAEGTNPKAPKKRYRRRLA